MLREDLKNKRNVKIHFSLGLADKSFNTYCLVPIFCSTIFEINSVLEIVLFYTKLPYSTGCIMQLAWLV